MQRRIMHNRYCARCLGQMKLNKTFFKYALICGVFMLLINYISVTINPTKSDQRQSIVENKLLSNLKMVQCLDKIQLYNNSKVITEQNLPLCQDVILQADTCSQRNGVDVFLLIIVISAPTEFEKRIAIRETWGSIRDDSVRIVFLMGKLNTTDSTENNIREESRKFHDILSGDFVDTYTNLTLKSVMMLKWASTICKHAQYVAKIDTDIYLNVPYLLNLLKQKKYHWSIIGRKLFFPMPDRRTYSKFYMSSEQYPYFFLPSYISGPSYVMSGDIVPSLMMAASRLELFTFEDVFVTGFCAMSVNADLYMEYGFARGKRFLTHCAFNELVNGHGYGISEIRQIHRQIQNQELKCIFKFVSKFFTIFE